MKSIPFSPPSITSDEIDSVVSVLKSGWITTGPQTKTFEKEIAAYTNTPRAVCFNSATAAMEMTLRYLGVGEGDEVITSAYTYTASCSVICHTGATPVLVDVKKDTFEMDPESLANAITERTKVVIPVDMGGKICDYKSIFQVLESKKHLYRPRTEAQKAFDRVVVLADAAHSFGATYEGQPSGSFADFTSFSFHAIKNLTTAEGGALVWKNRETMDNDAVYQYLTVHSLHGQNKDALAKTKAGAWEYDIISPGYKFNMPDVLAAIGRAQLNRYQDILQQRKDFVALYDTCLKEEGFMPLRHIDDFQESSCHLYLLRIPGFKQEDRNLLIQKMAEAGVACNVHFKPLPLFTAYKNLGFQMEDYPNAYAQYENEISLPLHNLLTEDDIRYICKTLIQSVKDVQNL